MTTTLLRAGALSCALLATTCLTAPALAQTQPSVYQHVDEYGVDLTDGSFNFGLAEGSIGSGEGAIALVRSFGTGGQRDNLSVGFQRNVSGGTATISLTFGNRTETFSGTSTATSFDSGQGNGATLTKTSESTYTYRDSDGTVTTYGPPPGLTEAGNNGYCSPGHETSCRLIALQTVRPNGHIVTYQWDVGENCTFVGNDGEGAPIFECAQFWRQRGLTNSFGYRIQFSFQQESNPGSGLPPTAWHTRSGAVLSNTAVSGSPTRTVSYSYPSSTVTEVTTDGNETWRFSRDSQQRLTGIRRPGSGSDDIALSYAAPTSMVVSQITADGVTANYGRSVSGSTGTMTRTDALSQQAVVVSDLTIGRPTSATDALSRQTSLQYDSNARPTRITQDEGNYTQFTYDARGNVTETRAVAKSGSGLPDMVTTASYVSTCTNPVTCNLPESVTDARGNVTDFTYDSTHGGLLTATAPAPSVGADRPQTRYGYTQAAGETEYMLTAVSACQSGTVASGCVDGADEARTVIGYDVNGNVTSLTRRNGDNSLSAPSAMTYDSHGNLVTVDGPLTGTADTIRFRYDQARRRIGTVSPDPDGTGSLKHRAQRTTYNSSGLATKVEIGTVNSQSDGDWAAFASLEEAQIDYDGNRRPVVQRLVSGSTAYALTQTSHDGLGRVQCVAQRMNPAEFGALPADACTLDTQGSHGPDRIARTTYDAVGQVTLVQTAYGVTGVAADEVAATYTDNGRAETVTDAESNRTTYVYDGHDRLSRTRMPSPTTDNVSSTTDYEELTYATESVGGTTRATPLVASRRLRDGNSIAFAYDALGRLTTKDLPGSEPTTTYSYDLFGRTTGASVPGHSLTFAFDALGRNLSQAGPLGTASYAYDLAGRRTRLTYPDSGLYVDYDHLVTGEVAAIRENGATSGAGLLATYAYDDRGRRTSLTRGNGTVTSYAYDNVSRPTQLVQDLNGTTNDLTLGFSYNPAAQIVQNTRSNDAYSFTAFTNLDVAFTNNGLNQMTALGAVAFTSDARGNIATAGGNSFTYTSENMLATASGGTTLGWDPLLRLHENVGGGATYRFGYDGDSLIGEYNGSNALQRRYVHGPGVDEPLVWYEGTGTSDRRWYHADERGSIVAHSDGSGNLVGGLNRYDEYGNPASGNAGRFQYTGQVRLSGAGLYHHRARIYWPGLGRFLQTDPTGYGDGMNLYTYVGGDPVNLSDPSGLCERPTGSNICLARTNSGSSGGSGDGDGGGEGSGGEGGGGGPPRRQPPPGICSTCSGSSLGMPGLSNGAGAALQGGYFIHRSGGVTSQNNNPVVTGNTSVWVPASFRFDGNFSNFSLSAGLSDRGDGRISAAQVGSTQQPPRVLSKRQCAALVSGIVAAGVNELGGLALSFVRGASLGQAFVGGAAAAATLKFAAIVVVVGGVVYVADWVTDGAVANGVGRVTGICR